MAEVHHHQHNTKMFWFFFTMFAACGFWFSFAPQTMIKHLLTAPPESAAWEVIMQMWGAILFMLSGTAYTIYMHSSPKATRTFGWANLCCAVMLYYAMATHRAVIFPSAFGWPVIYIVAGVYLILNSENNDSGVKKGAAHGKNEGHHHKHHPYLYYFFTGSIVIQSLFSFFFSELSVASMFNLPLKFNETDSYLVKCLSATNILFAGTTLATYMHASPKATRIFGYCHIAYSMVMLWTIYSHREILQSYMIYTPFLYTVVAVYLIYTTFEHPKQR